MDVVILLVFISLVLVGAGLVFFIYRLRAGDFEHGDRLALAPLANDEAAFRSPEPEPEHAKDSSESPEGGAPNVGS